MRSWRLHARSIRAGRAGRREGRQDAWRFRTAGALSATCVSRNNGRRWRGMLRGGKRRRTAAEWRATLVAVNGAWRQARRQNWARRRRRMLPAENCASEKAGATAILDAWRLARGSIGTRMLARCGMMASRRAALRWCGGAVGIAHLRLFSLTYFCFTRGWLLSLLHAAWGGIALHHIVAPR